METKGLGSSEPFLSCEAWQATDPEGPVFPQLSVETAPLPLQDCGSPCEINEVRHFGKEVNGLSLLLWGKKALPAT